MNLHRTARTLHRWLAWAIGLQMLAWLIGGVLFAWLPFQPWVKAQAVTVKPELVLPPQAGAALQQALSALAGTEAEAGAASGNSSPARAVRAVAAVPTALGPMWKLTLADGSLLRLPVEGGHWQAPDAAVIERYARTLYRGSGRPLGPAERLAQVPPRLGLVQELGGRRDVWRVHFDDALGTRLYFDAAAGEFLTARTEAWVWYDLLWRLHIMDYGGGEDFNNALLRGAAPLALLMALAGTMVAVQAAAYRLKARRRRQAPTG